MEYKRAARMFPLRSSVVPRLSVKCQEISQLRISQKIHNATTTNVRNSSIYHAIDHSVDITAQTAHMSSTHMIHT